jgi:hypothetical protein
MAEARAVNRRARRVNRLAESPDRTAAEGTGKQYWNCIITSGVDGTRILPIEGELTIRKYYRKIPE